MGWGVSRGAPALRVNRTGPDNHWFGSRPDLLVDLRGPEVDAVIEKVQAAVAAYPYAALYRTWPGPYSNTFTAFVGRGVRRRKGTRELKTKGHLGRGGVFIRTPSAVESKCDETSDVLPDARSFEGTRIGTAASTTGGKSGGRHRHRGHPAHAQGLRQCSDLSILHVEHTHVAGPAGYLPHKFNRFLAGIAPRAEDLDDTLANPLFYWLSDA